MQPSRHPRDPPLPSSAGSTPPSIRETHPSRHPARPKGVAESIPAADPIALVNVKTFDELFAELSEKAERRPEGSDTVARLDAGVHAIGKKIVEEAAEVWMAAEYESDEACAEEVSQLLYHLQVLMLAKGLRLQDVYRHL